MCSNVTITIIRRLVALPLQALSGECGFLAANLYARSIFGEDALANVSIEKPLGSSKPVQGHIRIRAKTQVCTGHAQYDVTNVLIKCCMHLFVFACSPPPPPPPPPPYTHTHTHTHQLDHTHYIHTHAQGMALSLGDKINLSQKKTVSAQAK